MSQEIIKISLDSDLWEGMSQEEKEAFLELEYYELGKSIEADKKNIQYMANKYGIAIMASKTINANIEILNQMASGLIKSKTSILNNEHFLELPKEYKMLWLIIRNGVDKEGVFEAKTAALEKLLDVKIDIAQAKKLFERWYTYNNGKWSIIGYNLIPKNKKKAIHDEPWKELREYPEHWEALAKEFTSRFKKSELNKYVLACSTKILTEVQDWEEWSGLMLYRRFQKYLNAVLDNG